MPTFREHADDPVAAAAGLARERAEANQRARQRTVDLTPFERALACAAYNAGRRVIWDATKRAVGDAAETVSAAKLEKAVYGVGSLDFDPMDNPAPFEEHLTPVELVDQGVAEIVGRAIAGVEFEERRARREAERAASRARSAAMRVPPDVGEVLADAPVTIAGESVT